MENKLEFGLKVLWDRDAVIREIEQEDEDIHRLKTELRRRRARPISRGCSTAG